MKEHNYIPRSVKIIDRFSLSKNCIGLRLKMKKGPLDFRSGQFVMLSVAGFGEIPIGITTAPHEKGYFEVAVNVVGLVSRKISSLKVGDEIGVNGPFGNGFPLSKIKGKDLVIVAGGIGIFPLRSIIRHIAKNKSLVRSLTILVGAKTPDSLYYHSEFKDWEKFATLRVIVDEPNDTWMGPTGMATDLFNGILVRNGTAMIVCGPPAMYPVVVKRFAGKKVSGDDLYFLLERRMKCGIGKCQHCTCGKFYVCLDGPVFSYKSIEYNKEALT